MKGLLKVLALMVVASSAGAGPVYPDNPEALVKKIEEAANHSDVVHAHKDAEENGGRVRRRAIEEAAQVYGLQSGRVARWRWLIGQINRMSKELDRAFPFQALQIEGKLQPPVLDVGSDISRIREDGRRLVQVRRMYRVKVPERFVHTPLSWLDFLQPAAVENPVFPREAMLPRNDEEMALWASVLRRSWGEGIRVADEEFLMRVAALESAFNGMVLYDMLALRGMIEPPEIAVIERGPAEVGGKGRQLAIGGHEELVARTAYFVGDVNQWKPIELNIPDELLR